METLYSRLKLWGFWVPSILGINERGSGKLRFSCITNTYVSELFLSIVT